MDEDFDFMQLEQIRGKYLGGERGLIVSSGTGNKIDEKVQQIINAAHLRAIEILKENMDKLHEISAYLLKEETITGEQFMEILNGKKQEDVKSEDVRENTDVDINDLDDNEVKREDLPPINDNYGNEENIDSPNEEDI